MRSFTALAAFALSSSLASAAPIDLNTWQQEGAAGNGTWNVAADGSSVVQTVNGDPTFFVSPSNFVDTVFDGSFGNTTSDNDYIGFVFGYQSPLQANGDANNDYSFFLFDWKQGNQNFLGPGEEGFNLSYVSGVVDGFGPFWSHANTTAPDPDFVTIADDHGPTRGWENNTLYDFTLIYQSDRIQISVDGGTGDFVGGETIFDVTPADVPGLEAFPEGRFGFYNYSQANVQYLGFTEDEAPPSDPLPNGPGPSPIPEPGTAILLGAGLAALSARRKANP